MMQIIGWTPMLVFWAPVWNPYEDWTWMYIWQWQPVWRQA